MHLLKRIKKKKKKFTHLYLFDIVGRTAVVALSFSFWVIDDKVIHTYSVTHMQSLIRPFLKCAIVVTATGSSSRSRSSRTPPSSSHTVGFSFVLAVTSFVLIVFYRVTGISRARCREEDAETVLSHGRIPRQRRGGERCVITRVLERNSDSTDNLGTALTPVRHPSTGNFIRFSSFMAFNFMHFPGALSNYRPCALCILEDKNYFFIFFFYSSGSRI